jgi:hypothetical protein
MFRIKQVEVYNYTSWYDVGGFSEDGSVTGQWAHGFKDHLISFSAGVDSSGTVGVSWSPSTVDVIEIAKVWTTFSTK